MITLSTATVDSLSWQEQLSSSICDPYELGRELNLDPEVILSGLTAAQQFQLRVPRAFLDRIEKGNPNDPLLKQVLPSGTEMVSTIGYENDPLEEQSSNPVSGLIHKYHGRVLLIVSPNCAVNCRYCFRRHFNYRDNKPGRSGWQQALDYLSNNDEINEVIFSGGDPLASSDKSLIWLTEQISNIPHIQRLRIHTRLPIVIPARITESCLQWLTGTRLKTVMVIHSNHANELDQNVADALVRLSKAGVTLLNQSVLLQGVNDCAETLKDLSERLFEVGVIPYYLHLPDKVQGTAHFDVTEARASLIYRQLMTRLPGYLLPKLVKEVAGEKHKTPIL